MLDNTSVRVLYLDITVGNVISEPTILCNAYERIYFCNVSTCNVSTSVMLTNNTYVHISTLAKWPSLGVRP